MDWRKVDDMSEDTAISYCPFCKKPYEGVVHVCPAGMGAETSASKTVEMGQLRASDELKACPFCGKPVEKYYNGVREMASCTNCCQDWYLDLWEQRPLEDALRADNERLHNEVILCQSLEAKRTTLMHAMTVRLELAESALRVWHDDAATFDDVHNAMKAWQASADGKGEEVKG